MNSENERDPLVVSHEPPLGWLVLNRPEVKNALNLRLWRRIAEGMAELDADPEVHVVVMRGAGERAFISGADISEFPGLRANAEQARAYRETPNRAVAAITNSPKPVIAMIAGVCVGGGVLVALSCDVRFAARGTRFGIPAARLGLAYPLEGVIALANVVGAASARDILLSARLFDADEALAMGLVRQVVEPAALEATVRDYALTMATNAPLTMTAAKTAIREALNDVATRDVAAVTDAIARCFNSEDYREGVRAFLEKRRPEFHGR